MKSWYDEAQEQDIFAVAEQLGMSGQNKRYKPCPACGVTQAGENDKRPPVRFSLTKRKPQKMRWFCQSCETMGNVFDLVSFAMYGSAAADLPRFNVLRSFFSNEVLAEIKKKPKRVEKIEQYPPPDEVKLLLDASTPLCDVQDRNVIIWAKNRGLDIKKLKNGPRMIDPNFNFNKLTKVNVKHGTSPWFPKSWSKKYKIILPLVDYKGNLRSVYARATSKLQPKCRAPIFYTTKNLFFVNKLAWEFLKGQTRPMTIWIVEGEMDFMSIMQLERFPVIGIRSGAIDDLMKMPWHITQTVVIGTDNDTIGDKYASQVAERVYPAQPKRLQLRFLKKKVDR